MAIYIGNIFYKATEEDIKKICGKHGNVIRVSALKDSETGLALGYAFVEMETEAAEQAVIGELNQTKWMGLDLQVSKAKSMK